MVRHAASTEPSSNTTLPPSGAFPVNGMVVGVLFDPFSNSPLLFRLKNPSRSFSPILVSSDI